mgnify:CR=1 FL=1
MNEEIFVPIEDFPQYSISNMGRVKNNVNNKIRKQYIPEGESYPQINLYNKETKERKTFRVHRLVALHFIPNGNPLKKTTVNHKNFKKTDNRVFNLEWNTPQANINHYLKLFDKKISQVINSNTGETYKSSYHASTKTGIDQSSIRQNCCGLRKTAGGFKWSYSN